MSTASYRAICSDFYINLRVNSKLDLPHNRETVLALFDRVRREFPAMDRFRRYSNELALESGPADGSYEWIALRRTSLRAGSVNPESTADAYRLHRLILQVAPYFLSMSPLDIDQIELLYGFDLNATGNHNHFVVEALLGGSPLAAVLDVPDATPIDCQPVVGIALDEACDFQALFDVKTRTSTRQIRSGEFTEDPISVCLTIRHVGSVASLDDMVDLLDTLVHHGERLVDQRLVPNLLMPLRELIGSGGTG